MTTTRERARAYFVAEGREPSDGDLNVLTALLEAVERETVERCAKEADKQAKFHHERYFMFSAEPEAMSRRRAGEQRCAKAAVEVCAEAIRALAPAREGE
jgi:hypothetical protein